MRAAKHHRIIGILLVGLFVSCLTHGSVIAAPLLLGPGSELVADINPSGSSSPGSFEAFNNELYFGADDGTHGVELWKYNPTTEQVTRITDINSGLGNSGINYITLFNGALYFNGYDGTSSALWKYDGTNASLAADVDDPSYLIVYDGALYFSANDGPNGTELWKFDGTSASLAADIDTNAGIGSSPQDFVLYSGDLYFSAYHTDYGKELWKFDGTNASLAADIVAGTTGSNLFDLAVYNSVLYFAADDGTNGTELWKFDGTTASLVDDINPGAGSSSPMHFIVYNSKLFFAANDGSHGVEFWSYDGTSTTLVKDINNGSGSSSPNYGVIYQGELFFTADDVTHGYEFWKYDGTTASLAVDIITGSLAGYPKQSYVFDDHIFFQGFDGEGHGAELMRYAPDTTGPTISTSSPASGATSDAISTIKVSFNEDMTHDGGTGAANYTGNYILIEAMGDGFQMNNCTESVGPQDTQISIDSAVYTNNSGAGPFETTLGVNGGISLPNGSYRLFVCGTTSVEDLSGNKINGGADSIIEFTVLKKAQVSLPKTGFAPDKHTILPVQPESSIYDDLDAMWLEIPALDVYAPIVGVPVSMNGWDLTWLGNQVGWLEGTAFPTWSGNSGLTAHVTDAEGQPGLFADLHDLVWGDQIMIHAWGQTYTYEVRSVLDYVDPDDVSSLDHEEYPWLTLITCRGYDQEEDAYRWRLVVRAVQLKVK